ncbi:hypothetical protein IMX26_05610 [Clostridium sp. 'deep sea']|uniref:hypothetical protein n=1 Tax=Clostridium sp. 'deep sea' TaxID=2779445 RepID=UPI00189697AE|nr:hypothetical protein [Clostridium sp. 'deep sea']QOR36290.1 hypothetical protein IMX26_05610 [Clostridium sp. 'deep sea']
MYAHKHEIYNSMVFYGPGNKIMHYKGKTFVNIHRKEKTGTGYHKLIIKDVEDDFFKYSQPHIVRIEAVSLSTGQLNIIFPHYIKYENPYVAILTSNINIKKDDVI